MATFPSITPTYGSSKSSAPKVRQVQFGDGYAQVIRYGLNQNPKSWSLKWEISETDADTIETFLDARGLDQESFDFTPPEEASAKKFVCDKWTKNIYYNDRATISATFREVFEP